MRKTTQQSNGTSVKLRDFTITFQAALVIREDCGLDEEEVRAAWESGGVEFGRFHDADDTSVWGCAYLGQRHIGYYYIDDGVLGMASRFNDLLAGKNSGTSDTKALPTTTGAADDDW